ncbi:MAG: ExeM/NucH family extracellular endonuclease, partial [Bacteroidota bacterium]
MTKLFTFSKESLMTLLFLLVSFIGFGQLDISSLGNAFTQNFDGIGTSTTATLPVGFKIGTDWSIGTTNTTRAAGTSGTGALNGTSAGGIYNFANGVTASSTDRAIGILNSGSFTSPQSIVLAITNNSGSTITSLNINFDYEKYRTGTRAFNWTFFHGSAATPSGSETAGDQSYGADLANAVVNPPTTISKVVSLTGLSIPSGSNYYFKWTLTGVGGSSNGQGIGIDNFSITASGVVQANLITSPTALSGLNYNEGSGPSASGNYTLTGTNLTGDITITAPTNFEISNSATFPIIPVGTLTVSPSSGSINTIIYTRLAAGLTANTYTGNISHSGGGLSSAVEVGLTGIASPPLVITKISAIQGSGATAAITGVATIEGIVTRTFLGNTKLNGFYVQEEEADYDEDPSTSEALFIFNPSATTVNVGDKVQLTGTILEFTSSTSSLTEMGSVTSTTIISTGNALPTVTNVQLPVTNVSDLERYEGMLINLSASSGNLTVTEVFQLGRYGQVVLSAEGASNQLGTDARLDQFTQFNSPSVSGYNLYLSEMAKRKIYLDDGSGSQNLDPIIFGRGGNPLSASNTLRGGDEVDNITAILDERFEGYRLQTTAGVNFQPINTRPNTPSAVGGTLKVAGFNVLNYFNGNGTGGGFPTSRGADNLTEFTRQRNKTIQAIIQSGADLFGLNEVENDGYSSTSAIQDLVNGVNDVAGPGTYAFITPALSIAADEITVGMIYKTSKVQPIGAAAAIPDAFGSGSFDVVGRKPLAQTFLDINAGGSFTFVINHFKSKGSSSGGIGDGDAGDGQGFSNGTRTRQAQDLLDWLATNPTGTTDPDYLIAGDFNSYAMEDPLTKLFDGGFSSVLPNTSYSYVFDGQVGSLDHALANTAFTPQVAGATKWHINSDEPIALDYNTEFKTAGLITSLYNADQFRASDHDPVIVGLNVKDDVAPTVTCLTNQIKNTDSGLCSYEAVGNEFNPTASSDNIGIVSTTFELTGATIQNGSSTLAGVLFNLGVTNVIWTVSDAANNSTTCSFTVTINKVNAVSTVSVLPVSQQYSDKVTFTATITNCVNAGEIGGMATFKVGTQVMGTAPILSDGTATLANTALLETILGQMAPTAGRTVTAEFSGFNTAYLISDATTSLEILAENAVITYTGSPFYSTSSATSSTVSVTLTATIQDIDDTNRGDIKNAIVKFNVEGVDYPATLNYVTIGDKTVATVVS